MMIEHVSARSRPPVPPRRIRAQPPHPLLPPQQLPLPQQRARYCSSSLAPVRARAQVLIILLSESVYERRDHESQQQQQQQHHHHVIATAAAAAMVVVRWWWWRRRQPQRRSRSLRPRAARARPQRPCPSQICGEPDGVSGEPDSIYIYIYIYIYILYHLYINNRWSKSRRGSGGRTRWGTGRCF
jgi:hypothetical protein